MWIKRCAVLLVAAMGPACAPSGFESEDEGTEEASGPAIYVPEAKERTPDERRACWASCPDAGECADACDPDDACCPWACVYGAFDCIGACANRPPLVTSWREGIHAECGWEAP